jgi:hypothetical protein
LIRVDGVLVAVLGEDFRIIKDTVTDARTVGETTGDVYHLQFGFGSVFPDGNDGFTSTDRMIITKPGGSTLVNLIIFHLSFNADRSLRVEHETPVLRCAGPSSVMRSRSCLT